MIVLHSPWGLAGAATNAKKETEALVAAYRACCPSAGKKADATCKAVDPFFDYTHLAQTTVVPLKKALNASQQKKLTLALEDIFAKTARQSGKALCQTAPRIGAEKPHAKGSEVALEMLEPGEDVPTRLAFVWRKVHDTWRVVDLELEGGSLITDYQNQFARIEHKEGAEGLVRRVQARRDNKEDATSKANAGSKD